MKKQRTRSTQIFLITATIVTWFAVVFQFYLILVNRVTTVPEIIIRFFSFYTILTNILVALAFTFFLLSSRSRLTVFFCNPNVITAITVYITVVGITYNLILRPLWQPKGLQQLVDELLHVIVPLLFIFYWLLFTSKNRLLWKNIFSWLIYPFVYVILILLRGAFSGYYPYPFIDVNKLGYSKVFLNCVGLFCVFFVLSILLVALTRIRSTHNK